MADRFSNNSFCPDRSARRLLDASERDVADLRPVAATSAKPTLVTKTQKEARGPKMTLDNTNSKLPSIHYPMAGSPNRGALAGGKL